MKSALSDTAGIKHIRIHNDWQYAQGLHRFKLDRSDLGRKTKPLPDINSKLKYLENFSEGSGYPLSGGLFVRALGMCVEPIYLLVDNS